MLFERHSKIEGNQVFDVDKELLPHGFIQTIHLFQMGYRTWREAVGGCHELYGVARHKTEKKEVGYGDKEQRNDAAD